MSVREIVDDRRSGAARARPRGRRSTSSRSPEIQAPDRRPDRDRCAPPTGPGSPPTRSASRCGSRSPRSRRQPALSVQAADPADRDRQPGDRAARRRAVEINEGCLSVPDLRGELAAPRRRSGVRYLDRDGAEHERSSAGSPRAPSSTRSTTSTGSCSSTASRPATLTTWEQFERFHRDAFVERITRRSCERVGS